MKEKRIARICWNTNGWTRPSGKKGKSNSKNTFENQNGFGGEEWLFDFTKTIDGYKYGFLQPFWNEPPDCVKECYSGNFFDIGLYAINSENKQYYCIGEIMNVKVLNKIEIQKIQKLYEDLKWDRAIKRDLNDVGIFDFDRSSISEYFFVNIKFKPFDVKMKKEPIPIEKFTKNTRYSTFLYDKKMIPLK